MQALREDLGAQLEASARATEMQNRIVLTIDHMYNTNSNSKLQNIYVVHVQSYTSDLSMCINLCA